MWKWTNNNFEVFPLNVNEEMVFDGQRQMVEKQIGDKTRVFMFVFVLHSDMIYGENLAEIKSEIKCVFIHVCVFI